MFGGTGADSWQPEGAGMIAAVYPDGSPIVHEACNNSVAIASQTATLPANRTIVPMPMCLKATPDSTAGEAPQADFMTPPEAESSSGLFETYTIADS